MAIIWLQLLLGFGVLSCSLAANIVLLPMFGGSHYMVLAKLGDELSNRGHKVTVITGNTERTARGKPHSLAFHVAEPAHSLIAAPSTATVTSLQAYQRLLSMHIPYCKAMFDDPRAMEEIKRADVIIGDSAYPCSTLAAAKFSLPHVSVARRLFSPFLIAYGTHRPPSYVPHRKLSYNMSFSQRALNVLALLFDYYLFYGLICPAYEGLKSRYNITPHVRTSSMLGTIDLILVQLDFTIEVPRPLLPNTRVVGPFMPGPAKPLSPELEEFIQSSGDDGVVLVSFGTFYRVSKRILQTMAVTFSKLPQKVIWKIKPENVTFPLSKNIKTMAWLPQNDILGHSKVKLFFGHGGINGLFECVYHGVPQVLVPLAYDQFSNADMAKHHGIAEYVDIHAIESGELAADGLAQVMRTVISEPSYKESVVRLSKLIRLKPRSPVSEAADWVEYLLAVGSLSHLRPQELDLPFYQLYLLDVLLASPVFLFSLLWLVRAVLSCISRRLFRSGRKEKLQ